MTGRLAATLVLAAAGLILGAAPPVCAAAQAQPSPSVPATPSGASDPGPAGRLVQLDAVVTDGKGKPIPNLGPDDFEVVEDGVVQKLNAVETRGDRTRVFALLLDEFHVSPGAASDRVREFFGRFLDEQVRPSDLIAVLRPLESVTEIPFTHDRDAARAEIEKFTGRKGDYEARSEFERKYIGRAPEAVDAARAQIVLSGVRALASRLSEIGQGRSAILIVSEGFAQPGGRTIDRRVPDVQAIVRAASRANAAVYAFDPQEISATKTGDQPSGSDTDPGKAFLRAIAAQTGGAAVMKPADFVSGLERVSRDLDGYYLLNYTSSHPGDGRFYDVQVRVKPSGAHVRARSGYWAPVRAEPLSASSRRTVPPRVIRRSPLIQTWLGLTVSPEGAQTVTFTWTPADVRGRGAAALPQPAVVALKATTPEGAVLFDGEIAAARGGGMGVTRDEAAFFQAEPGRVQLDLILYAADGSQIDQAAQDADVPDVRRADPLILPPRVFTSLSAREFRDIRANPDAAPIPTREFRRTERLLVRVPTFSSSGVAVKVAARLLNRSGQRLREIKPIGRPEDGMTQFDLPLSWLAPGEYAIELDAASSAGAAKEIIRIRVTG